MLRAVVVVVLVGLLGNVTAKICPSMDVRSYPSSLEKLRNCSVIVGKLHFVLFDSENKVPDGSFERYSFPELEEIVDYLMVFRVLHLRTLANLFPNLRTIRGREKFMGKALILWQVPDLQEIGLPSLQHLGGNVTIYRCPNLCHVPSIDWYGLGADTVDFQEIAVCNNTCPEHCPHCWNGTTCQKPVETCKYLKDNGQCIEKCPANKVANYVTRVCLLPRECLTMMNKTWWIYNDTCINECPFLYEKDDTVPGRCRYVGREKYVKECEGKKIREWYQWEALMECTHITMFLDLHISEDIAPHLSRFLQNIVSIGMYLRIGRTSAITSLEFLENLKVIKGTQLYGEHYALFVYENENLRKLFKENSTLTILNGTIGFHDNPQLCISEIKKLKKIKGLNEKKMRDLLSFAKRSNGVQAFCNQKDVGFRLTEVKPTEVTIEWQPQAPKDDVLGYNVYYKKINEDVTRSDKGCDLTMTWIQIFVMEERVQLTDLIPFTQYLFYIRTYTTGQEAHSPTYNFTTACKEPTEPLEVDVESTDPTTIVLSWLPPLFANGILTSYRILKYENEVEKHLARQRNYCKCPHVALKATPTLSAPEEDNCTCSRNTFEDLEQSACQKGELETCFITTYPSHYSYDLKRRKNEEILVAPNQTFYEFKHLRQYTLYSFSVQACNMRNELEVQCGSAIMVFQRTMKMHDADRIREFHVVVEGGFAIVDWQEPFESNSFLVAFNVEYKRTDSGSSKPRTECVTFEKYSKTRAHKIGKLNSGKYAVHIQVVSLAGPGNFSEWQYFEIASDNSIVYWIVGAVICGIALVSVMVFFVFFYKPKVDINHLITNINPDYAGPVYVEDDWEIDRKDIEFKGELGNGTFGMVYQGLIKSRKLPCAIKTVNESATVTSRCEFLNEGAVMKSFSDAYHVIKLLGIVSRGHPPLVVMELMERGDLKTYLRRCRGPSQNLTTNELYRMAAEIADGMAYLAAKKFVHRDLAARNCMVAADRTVKVGDFGMARDIYETDYYRKETKGLLPVRWMAPESLADGVFTSDSDVWSYGVVLWEMATLAEQPYQGLSNEEVFKYVKSRGRLGRPPECSNLLYEVMDACWNWRPNERPTFGSIVTKLADHVGEDFKLVAFCYTREFNTRTAGPRPYNPPAKAPESEYVGYDPGEQMVSLFGKPPNRPAMFLPSQRMSPGSSSSLDSA